MEAERKLGEGMWKQRETNMDKDCGSREKPTWRRTVEAEREQLGRKSWNMAENTAGDRMK